MKPAIVVVMEKLPSACVSRHWNSGERAGKGKRGRGKRHRPEKRRHRARNPAQQADEGKGPDAGRARAALFVAFAPAALEPDQKADRERKAEALEEFSGIHAKAGPILRRLLAGDRARIKL